MSWRAITNDDVYSAHTRAEASAVSAELLVDGQEDPLATVIAQVTLEVREAIRSCQDNRLHSEPTCVPEGAIRHAVAIIRHRLLTRFDAGAIGEARLMEYREATRYLDNVAACKRAVEDPSGGEEAPAPVTLPRVTARERQFTRESQEGI
jgi:hypothetical protein